MKSYEWVCVGCNAVNHINDADCGWCDGEVTTARITATYHDGTQWGWGNVPVMRYEVLEGPAKGTWAWIPGTGKVGDVITV
jgi:hypothetical protein